MWYKDILSEEGLVVAKEKTSNYAEATKYNMGKSTPDVYGAIINDIEFKGFDLSLSLYYSIGGKIYDDTYRSYMHDGTKNVYQLSTDALNAWRHPGHNTDVPRYIYNNASNSNSISSRWLVNGSFLKLKNITLGYSLPENFVNTIHMRGVRIFATVDNLYTFTEYQSGDPEQRLSGISNNYDFPNSTTWRFGINVNL